MTFQPEDTDRQLSNLAFVSSQEHLDRLERGYPKLTPSETARSCRKWNRVGMKHGRQSQAVPAVWHHLVPPSPGAGCNFHHSLENGQLPAPLEGLGMQLLWERVLLVELGDL